MCARTHAHTHPLHMNYKYAVCVLNKCIPSATKCAPFCCTSQRRRRRCRQRRQRCCAAMSCTCDRTPRTTRAPSACVSITRTNAPRTVLRAPCVNSRKTRSVLYRKFKFISEKRQPPARRRRTSVAVCARSGSCTHTHTHRARRE